MHSDIISALPVHNTEDIHVVMLPPSELISFSFVCQSSQLKPVVSSDPGGLSSKV